MVKSIILSVFLLLSFIACKPINIEKPNVTSVSIVGDQLIVRGSNFLNIEGLALSTTGYNKPFQVTSVSQSQIVGVAVDSQKVTVPSLLNLIIDSAQGQSTYPVSFSLQANSVSTGTIQNGAVTRLKLNKEPTDNPADGDVLSWDSGSGQFVFAPYNAGGGGGGSVTSVTRGIGIANQGTSITTNGTISVNTGITGSSTSTVIPFFNSANQIEIGSTAEIFLPGPGANYYILNNAGKFAIQNSASLDTISVDNSGNVNIPISLKVANQSVCLADGTNCLTGSGDVTGPSTSNVNRVSVFSDGTGKVIKEALFSVPTTAPPIGSILKATAANTLSWVADSLGDVVGMSSSTDGHLTSYQGTSGTQIQDSGLLVANIPIMVSPAPSSNTIILSAGNSKSLSSTSYTIPASSCANGQILKTDSSGNFICADDTSGVTLFNGRAGDVTPTDGDYTASQITNLPGFGLTAINVQSAIDEIQNNKLPLAGGTMTGTITTSSTMAILIGPSGGATGEIHYLELPGNGTNTVGFKAPTSIASDIIWTLPASDGASGAVLTTNGNKVLGWTSIGSGGVGDVVGPSSSTDGHLASFQGATGKQIQDSGLLTSNITTMLTNPIGDQIVLSVNGSKQLVTTNYSVPPAIGTDTYVLKSNGTNVTWQQDEVGAGDVVGPGSSASGTLPIFSDNTGKNLGDSTIIANDIVTMSLPAQAANRILTSLGANKVAIDTGITIDIANNISGIANFTSTGNMSVDTNTFFVDSTNNRVGIGTNTPAVSFEIKTANNSGVLIRQLSGQNNTAGEFFNGLMFEDPVVVRNAAFGMGINPSGLFEIDYGSKGGSPSYDRAFVLSPNGTGYFYGTLSVNNSDSNKKYEFPDNRGLPGQVLATSGTGTTYWTTVAGTGDVVGPGTSASGTLPLFSDSTGKKLGDSTLMANDVVTMTSLGTGDYVLKSTLGSKTASESNVLVLQIATMASDASSTDRMILSAGSDKSLKTTGYKVPPEIGTATYVLKSNGANVDWAPDVGGGDVTGPNSSRANVPALFSNTTGKIITDGDASLMDFNTTGGSPAWKEGRLYYDLNTKALAYYSSSNGVPIEIGQQMVFLARNNTGSTIPIGSAVYVTGSNGQRPTIGLAKADSVATSRVIGFTSQNINNNNEGYVTNFGLVRNLNTSPFNEGDILYLSDTVAGAATNTAPAFPVPIGRVIFDNPSNGIIGVAPVIGAGNVFGPANSVDGRPAIFSGTSGKQLVSTAPFTLPTITGTNGQVLTTNGAGSTSWTTVAGTGDVLGPTTNASGTLALWDGDNSKKLKQTNYTFPTMDGTFGQILRTNGTGTVGWVDPPARAALEYPYQFDDSTANSDPGSGDVRINNTDPLQATFIYISEQDKNNPSVNRSSRFLLLKAGDLVDISSSSNGNDDYMYTVSATPTDAGNYIQIPVAAKTISGTITNNLNVVVALIYKSPTLQTSLAFEPSDLRIKTAIKPIDSSLENILKLNTIRYKWKYENDQRYQVGLDAEEVKDLFPDLIGTISPPLKSKIDEEILGINYSKMVVPLIKAFQEKAKADERTIQMLTDRIERLEKMIEKQKR